MKSYLVLLLGLLVLVIIMLPAYAYAQSVVPTAPPALSVAELVMLTVSFLFAASTQAQQSGKLFGQFVIPAKAMVALGIVVPFLGGFATSLGTVAFSEASVVRAVFAGLMNLFVGSLPGLAVHAHFVVPEKMAARAARLAAMSTACFLFVVSAAGCAQLQSDLSAFEQAVTQGSSLIAPASSFACTVAKDVDPSGSTAICQQIASDGSLIGEAFTIVESVAAINALTAKTSSTMQSIVRTNYLAKHH